MTVTGSPRDEMPEIVEYAIRQAGVDPDDVADWRISTDLIWFGLNLDVALLSDGVEQVGFAVVKDDNCA